MSSLYAVSIEMVEARACILLYNNRFCDTGARKCYKVNWWQALEHCPAVSVKFTFCDCESQIHFIT